SFAAFILALSVLAAMVWANSVWGHTYRDIFSHGVTHWINDGLMVLFFLLVGLEIKRELTTGELASRDSALLPLVAALGGIIVPAIIFAVININAPENMRGWAIPTA